MTKLFQITTLVLVFLNTSIGYSQLDSLKQKKPFFTKNKIVPLSLIGAGLYVNYAGGSLGKKSLQHNIQDGINFNTRADDFLQFGPEALLYSANIFGIKGANDIKTQTKNIALVTISNYMIIKGLKEVINIDRPNGSKNGFPSGHTSYAFSLARLLQHEYKDSSPILAYSGYAFAATTGVFRVLNNKHWVSDVLAGAGIGILITDIIYCMQPFKTKKPKKHTNLNAIFVPTINQNTFGFTGVITF